MKIVFLALLLSTSVSAYSQKLVMTDETSTVSFVTKFIAGMLEGTFKGVNGNAVFHPNDLNNAYFKLTFSPATVTTSDNQFGPDLIRSDCFNAKRYPSIELFSTKITKAQGENKYNLYAQLKIKAITKNIVIPLTATSNVGGYDFTFGFEISRKAFGLKCPAVGRDFKVSVKTYGKKV